jgi:hypothetical protein
MYFREKKHHYLNLGGIMAEEDKMMLREAITEEREMFAQAEKVLGKEAVNKIAFVTFIINEFGEAYKIDKQEGYRYLKQYGGLDFIHEHWWALHIDNPRHVLREIFDLCKENGGWMR